MSIKSYSNLFSLPTAVKEVLTELQAVKLYIINTQKDKETFQAPEGVTDLEKRLCDVSKKDLTKEVEEGKSTDKLLFIYTSGTTGLPKAAIINNNRFDNALPNA